MYKKKGKWVCKIEERRLEIQIKPICYEKKDRHVKTKRYRARDLQRLEIERKISWRDILTAKVRTKYSKIERSIFRESLMENQRVKS